LSTFELTIQNTTIPQVRNLFSVIAVFISFPLARGESRGRRSEPLLSSTPPDQL
jgi:hypothetical protein